MRCFGGILVAIAISASSMGCALTHEAQPHRLWRFNRGPGPSSNPYFSVSDPILPSASSTAARTAGWTPYRPDTINKLSSVDPAHEPPVADLD